MHSRKFLSIAFICLSLLLCAFLFSCGSKELHFDESVGKKIRSAVLEKTPYILVLGDREMEEETVAVRKRGSQETTTMSLDEFKAEILNNIATKSLTV